MCTTPSFCLATVVRSGGKKGRTERVPGGVERLERGTTNDGPEQVGGLGSGRRDGRRGGAGRRGRVRCSNPATQ